MLAPNVGRLLEGCKLVCIPFGGGMAEVPHITARSLVVNDLHRHIINLARVAAHPVLGPKLYRILRRPLFHPDELATAQFACNTVQPAAEGEGDLWPAVEYFKAAWMNRSALAGTDGEFRGGLPVRFTHSGGDSNTRYRSAVASLPAWRRTLARCNFTCMDAFEFLKKCKDEAGTGIYCDPPFPGVGDGYRHKFTREHHLHLAETLAGYTKARIVVRYYADPLVGELYSDASWKWHRLEGRDQNNDAKKPEVLLVRNG